VKLSRRVLKRIEK